MKFINRKIVLALNYPLYFSFIVTLGTSFIKHRMGDMSSPTSYGFPVPWKFQQIYEFGGKISYIWFGPLINFILYFGAITILALFFQSTKTLIIKYKDLKERQILIKSLRVFLEFIKLPILCSIIITALMSFISYSDGTMSSSTYYGLPAYWKEVELYEFGGKVHYDFFAIFVNYLSFLSLSIFLILSYKSCKFLMTKE